MPEPGMGSRGSRSGSGMGGGGGYAGPELDWGMGPEGSEGTVSSSRSGEDRDFGDDVSLQQKTAFMATSKPAAVTNVTHYLEDTTQFEANKHKARTNPVSTYDLVSSAPTQPVSPAYVSTPTEFEAQKHKTRAGPVSTYDASSSPVSNVEGTINQPGGPMSALDLALGVPKNMADEIYRNLEFGHPFLESGVSKEETDRLIDIFAKRNVEGIPTDYSNVPKLDKALWEGFPTGSKAPWNKTLQDLNKEWELGKKFPGNFLGPSYKKAALLGPLFSSESHPTYAPHTYSVGGGYSGGPATQTLAGNWGKMMSASKPTVNMRYGTTDWLGSYPPGVEAALSSLMGRYKEKTDLEKQASENSGISRFFPGGYSPTGNIYNRSILEANILADKYANMYGLPKKAGENPATPNRWGLYDLARHGFLASQVGLAPAQYAERFRSTGQPSDYTNNMLANRFMRQHQRRLGASGILSKNFGLSPVGLTSDMYGNPMSPSSRPSTPTDAWMRMVVQEMMNPGSTGYDINFNVSD